MHFNVNFYNLNLSRLRFITTIHQYSQYFDLEVLSEFSVNNIWIYGTESIMTNVFVKVIQHCAWYIICSLQFSGLYPLKLYKTRVFHNKEIEKSFRFDLFQKPDCTVSWCWHQIVCTSSAKVSIQSVSAQGERIPIDYSTLLHQNKAANRKREKINSYISDVWKKWLVLDKHAQVLNNQ